MPPSMLHEMDKIVMTAINTDHHDEVIAVGIKKLATMFPDHNNKERWHAMLTARVQHEWKQRNKQGGNK